ncbi:hypothetical protein DFH09DRAFT_1106253 [Mycena vulgaris]|nr:hypothetical protein DFH09DRAFT_1106253 [Mycena vulgaris]
MPCGNKKTRVRHPAPVIKPAQLVINSIKLAQILFPRASLHPFQLTVRPTFREGPCEYFLLRHVMNAIVEKAHVCTSLENLKVISVGWDYPDTHGEQLFKFLSAVLTGFNQIFQDRARGAEPSSDSDADDGSATASIHILQGYATVAVLKSFCRELGLSHSRVKSTLVDRLVESYIS